MKAERMLYVPSKGKKGMRRIFIMTESIESAGYLFSKIAVMSWLRSGLPADGSVLLLYFPFNFSYPFKCLKGRRFFFSFKVVESLYSFDSTVVEYQTCFFSAMEQHGDGRVGQREMNFYQLSS